MSAKSKSSGGCKSKAKKQSLGANLRVNRLVCLIFVKNHNGIMDVNAGAFMANCGLLGLFAMIPAMHVLRDVESIAKEVSA